MDRIIYVVWQITIDYSKSKNIVKLNLIKLFTRWTWKKKSQSSSLFQTIRARKIVFRFTQSRNFNGQTTLLSIGKSSFTEHKLVRLINF